MPVMRSLDEIADKLIDNELNIDVDRLNSERAAANLQQQVRQQQMSSAAQNITRTAQFTPRPLQESVASSPTVTSPTSRSPFSTSYSQTMLNKYLRPGPVRFWTDEMYRDTVKEAEERNDPGFWGSLFNAVIKPLEYIMKPMQWYFEHVTRPLAGLHFWVGYKAIPGMQPGEQHFMEEFRKAKEEKGAWMGFTGAFNEMNIPAWGKILLEMSHDPAMYIPYIGALGRLPIAGASIFPRIARAYTAAMDAPFVWGMRGVKGGTSYLERTIIGPATFQQAKVGMQIENSVFKGMVPFVRRINPEVQAKSLGGAGVGSTRRALDAAEHIYKLHPKSTLRKEARDFVDGLAQAEAITEKSVARLARKVGGKPEAISLSRATELIESGRFRLASGKGSVDAITDEVITALGADVTVANQEIIRPVMERHANLIKRIRAEFEDEPVGRMLQIIAKRAGKEQGQLAREAHEKWRVEAFGALGGVINDIESHTLGAWNNVINRWMVAPFSEAYLGFSFYFVMNALEEMFRYAIGKGGRPGRFPTREEFMMETRGLEEHIPPHLMERAGVGLAAENMLVKTAAQRAGAWSFLRRFPIEFRGKTYHPGDYLGKKYIEWSNVFGTGVRRKYLMNRYNENLRMELNLLNYGKTGQEQFLKNIIASPPQVKSMSDRIDQIQKMMTRRMADGDTEGIYALNSDLTWAKILERKVDEAIARRPQVPQGLQAELRFAARYGGKDAIEKVFDSAPEKMLEFGLSKVDFITASYKDVLKHMMETPIKTKENIRGAFGLLTQMAAQHSSVPSSILRVTAKHAHSLEGFPERQAAVWERGFAEINKFHDECDQLLKEMMTTIRNSAREHGQPLELIDGYDTMAEHYTYMLDRGALARKETIPMYKSKDFERIEARWHQYGEEIAERQGAWAAATENFGVTMGYPRRGLTSSPHDFNGGDISIAKLAEILGGGPQDLVRSVMDASIITGRKDFIKRIGSYVRSKKIAPGTEQEELAYTGISDEALGRLYDRILASFGASDEGMTMLKAMELEMSGLRQDLKAAYVSPKATEKELADLRAWIDQVAEASKPITGNPARVKQLRTAREKAMKRSLEELDRYFVKYDDPNLIDWTMKHLFPYWTYEAHRLVWLPRMALQHPGLFLTGMSRYADYTDKGYFPIMAGLEMSPIKGTIFGGARRLILQDYPEYYSGDVYETLDFMGRFGFYPNVAVMGAVNTLGFLDEGKSQFGSMVPTIAYNALDTGIALGVPGMQEMRQTLIPDRFRDYLINQVMIMDYKVDMGEVQKALDNPNLSDAERAKYEDLMKQAERKAALYNILASQTGLVRLYPKERREFWTRRAEAIQSMTGLTVDQQDDLRNRGMHVSDVVTLSPAQGRVLRYLEGAEWSGVTEPLRPLHVQEVMQRQDDYWASVENMLRKRVNEQAYDDAALVRGELTQAAYYERSNERWDAYIHGKNALKEQVYSDVPTTWQESAKLLEEQGLWVAPPHPIRQLLDDYYSIETPLKPNGTKDYEAREQLRMDFLQRVPIQYRTELVEELLRNRTSYEQQQSFLQGILKYAPELQVGQIYRDTFGVQRMKQVQRTAQKYGIPEENLNLTPQTPLGAETVQAPPLPQVEFGQEVGRPVQRQLSPEARRLIQEAADRIRRSQTT